MKGCEAVSALLNAKWSSSAVLVSLESYYH